MDTRAIFNLLCLLVTLGLVAPVAAFSTEDISSREASGGLKEALIQGTGKAVESLGHTDGFLSNPKVRIPLPPSVDKASGMMRSLGMGKYIDELETAMNRAAEAAVPEAKNLLVAAVKGMSVSDARAILTGNEDAATQYFRRSTADPLARKFQPIVRKAMEKVSLAEKYDRFASKAAKLGLIREGDVHLDAYVTQKALDGLYLMIADEEKAIRQDPVGAAGKLARKVFGTIRP
jgi:hypothetical protein